MFYCVHHRFRADQTRRGFRREPTTNQDLFWLTADAKPLVALQATVPIDAHQKVRLTVEKEEEDAILYRFFVVRHLRPTALPLTSHTVQAREFGTGKEEPMGVQQC
jgi:hypothetical protein